MGKNRKLVVWDFDAEKWSTCMTEAYHVLGDDLPEYIGVSKSRIFQWINNTGTSTCPHPGMGLFLKIVDLIDVDPREMFILRDVE